MPAVDVLAALRPDEVAVTCFGRSWRLDLGSAGQWLGAIGCDVETLTGVLPGSVGDSDIEQMWMLTKTDPNPDRRCLNAARAAVGRGAGRDWWWAVNLSKRIVQGWPYINGQMLLSGIHAYTTSFPDYLDAVYMLLWRNGDDEARRKFDLELQLPPMGVAVRQTRRQKIDMAEAFAAD